MQNINQLAKYCNNMSKAFNQNSYDPPIGSILFGNGSIIYLDVLQVPTVHTEYHNGRVIEEMVDETLDIPHEVVETEIK